MGITILTIPTGLMLTCETSKYKVEIILTINFSIIIIVMPLHEQTLLLIHLYAVKIRILYISSRREEF